MRPAILRPFVFPSVLLALLEAWARTTGAGSDAVAPPSLALRALLAAAGDGSLLGATGFTLGTAALGLLLGCAGGCCWALCWACRAAQPARGS